MPDEWRRGAWPRRLALLPAHSPGNPAFGWSVVKYHNEARIFLPNFDRAAVHTPSNEFGLPVLEDPDLDSTPM